MNSVEQFAAPETPASVATTALTLSERAQIALGSSKTEVHLADLIQASKNITEIKNLDGRTECHSAYMQLKNSRTMIIAAGKSARDDANKFSKAVIAEEERLIEIISPEEARLKDLRDAWDKAVAEEVRAKAEAERVRIADIKARIQAVANIKVSMLGKTLRQIEAELIKLNEPPEYDTFYEFASEYKAVRESTIEALTLALNHAKAAEAEAARIAAEREAMEVERKEMAARMAELRAQKDALELAEKERIAATQKAAQEAERERERMMLAESAPKTTPSDQFTVRSAVIQREQASAAPHPRFAPQATVSDIQQESKKNFDAEYPQNVHPAIAAKMPAVADIEPERPTLQEIIEVVADHFDTDQDTARMWIAASFQVAQAA